MTLSLSDMPQPGYSIRWTYWDGVSGYGTVRTVHDGIVYIGATAAVVPNLARKCEWRAPDGEWQRFPCLARRICANCGEQNFEKESFAKRQLLGNAWYCSDECRLASKRRMNRSHSERMKVAADKAKERKKAMVGITVVVAEIVRD